MNQVFRYVGLTKQAFHQRMDRMLQQREQDALLLPLITELRQEHPGVAARQLYLILKPSRMGRDRFERLCFNSGLKLPQSRSYSRTTNSSGVIRFPNLIQNREFKGINQAWASDITYYQIRDEFYYLTFIIDLFSRAIVGFSVSSRLLTEHTTLPALKMAVQARKPKPGLIFHSDGGGQYYCKEFLKLTQGQKMSNSMCDVAYENPMAERVNGTIKNQYLKGYSPQTFMALGEQTKRAVRNYNYVRPHSSLKNKTPMEFEAQMPAGGSSSKNDDFCTRFKTKESIKKNHHSQMTDKLITKRVQKTVNVF